MLTVTTAAADPNLLSAAEIAEALAGTGLTATQMRTINARISQKIASACNVARAGTATRTLRAETLRESFNLRVARSPLFLSRKPLIEVLTVTEVASALEVGDWRVDDNAIVRLSGSDDALWSTGETVIAYRAGWETVPEELKDAALKYIEIAQLTGGRDPLLKRKVTEGVSEYEWWVDPTKDSDIPADVMSILENGGYVNRQWGM